jgi:hypothetical protein
MVDSVVVAIGLRVETIMTSIRRDCEEADFSWWAVKGTRCVC